MNRSRSLLTIGASASVGVAGGAVGSNTRAAAILAVADSGSAVAGRDAAATLDGVERFSAGLRHGHGRNSEGKKSEDVLQGNHC
jgi:hypothetical protein